MADEKSNLPKNEDPRPQTGSIVPGSPVQSAWSRQSIPPELEQLATKVMAASSPIPENAPTTPPPMPTVRPPLKATASPVPDFDFDDVVHATVDRVIKKITVGGQPGVAENGKVDFQIPASTSQENRGPTVPQQSDATPAAPTTGAATNKKEGEKAPEKTELETKIEDLKKEHSKQWWKSDEEKAAEVEALKSDAAKKEERDYAHSQSRGVEGVMADLKQGDRQLTGESNAEYKERSAILREKDPEKRSELLNAHVEKALGKIDLRSIMPNSYIPMCVTRADGRTKSLIYVKSAATVSATDAVSRDAGDYFDSYTHPFKILTKKEPRGSTISAGVVYYSHLFKGFTLAPQTITGLLSRASDSGSQSAPQGDTNTPPTPQSSPSPNGSSSPSQPNAPSLVGNGINGWVAVNDNDYIYLEITLANGSVTDAQIKVGSSYNPSSTPWTANSSVEKSTATPPTQTKARIALGKRVGGVIEQYVTTNLMMRPVCIAGVGALYPTPY